MSNSNAYLKGNVNFNMRVTKMDDGRFKASCQGLESFHNDQSAAVIDLQGKLQKALLTGELKPGI